MSNQTQSPVSGEIVQSEPYHQQQSYNNLQKIVYRQSLNVDQFNDWLGDNASRVCATEIHCQDTKWSYDFLDREYSCLVGHGELNHRPADRQERLCFSRMNLCHVCSDIIDRLEGSTRSGLIDENLEEELVNGLDTTSQDTSCQQLQNLGWMTLESGRIGNNLEQPIDDFAWLTIRVYQDFPFNEIYLPSRYYKKNQINGFSLMINFEGRHQSFVVSHCPHSNRKFANILKSVQYGPDNQAGLVDAIVCDCQYFDVFHRHQNGEDSLTVGGLTSSGQR